MAKILKRCDRTIRRDLKIVRKQFAEDLTIEDLKILIGEYLHFSQLHYRSLLRKSKDARLSPTASGALEYQAFKVLDGMMERLQKMGRMPYDKKPESAIEEYFKSLHKQDSNEKKPKDIEEIEKKYFQLNFPDREEITRESKRHFSKLVDEKYKALCKRIKRSKNGKDKKS